jgi:hypothetical protein
MKFRKLKNFDITGKRSELGVNNIYLSAAQKKYVEMITNSKILISDN